MQLRYTAESGQETTFTLKNEKTIIGRAMDADLALDSDRVSRHHAEIRFWGGDHVLKDLGSRNGTFVNGEKVEVAKLSSGDRIRIGGLDFFYEDRSPKAPNTVLRRIGEEMEEGKGYRTILRSIVSEATHEPGTQKASTQPKPGKEDE